MDLVWQICSSVGGVIIICLVVFKIYLKSIMGQCSSKADLTGKTAVVTGANTGIGYWTALDLARRNARVILGCRNLQKGEAAVLSIIMKTGNMNVLVKQLDVSLMKSIRQFAEQFLAEEPRLDILVNNAGVAGQFAGKFHTEEPRLDILVNNAALPLTMTEEGLEMVYATNHFGPFLLTNLLLDLLKKSQPSRIVNVSSVVHGWTKTGIAFDNLRAEKEYGKTEFYQSSKLANVLFTRELARRLEGSGVITHCLHPGPVDTQLLFEVMQLLPFFLRILHPLIVVLYLKTPEEGAQTSIYCAVSEELEGKSGKYYVDCKEADDQSSDASKDMGVAKKLWEISEKYTGLVKTE